MNGSRHAGDRVSDDELKGLQLNFLAGIPVEAWLPILAGTVYWGHQASRGLLYEQDTPIEAIYALVEGEIYHNRIDTYKGRRIQCLQRTVGPGALLGLYEFLFDEFYRTNARAYGACTIVKFDVQAFSRLIYHFPQIREKLIPQRAMARLRTFPFVTSMAMAPSLYPIALGFMAEVVEPRECTPEQPIYAEGDFDDHIYLLDDGQVKLEGGVDGGHLLGNGAIFGAASGSVGAVASGSGDRAMAHTATSQTKTKLYTLPHHIFVSVTGLNPDQESENEIKIRENAIRDLDIFGALSEETQRLIAGYVSHIYFPHIHLIVQQGEEADSLWVLLHGGASIRALDKGGNQMFSASAVGPTYFAEEALLGQVSQESTVEAQPGSTWLRFHWRDLEAVSRQTKSNLRAQLRIRTSKVIRPNDEDSPPEYEWLQPGEQVIIFSRRHWVAFLRKMLPAIVTFVLLFVFLAVANFLPGPQAILRIIIIFLLVLDGLAIAWGTVDYLNDWLVITNRRVVHQEKVLFVNEWRKEAPLEQIQNVNFESDWLGKILNYGTMTIATAATVGTISFDYTRQFSELRSTIMAQREQRRRHTVAESKTAINRMLEARLGMSIAAPSRVYHGGAAAPPLTGWRKRMSESLNTRLRKEQGNRVIWRKHWLVLIPRLWWPLLIFVVVTVLAILPPLTEVSGAAAEETFPLLHALTVAGVVATLIALARVIWVVADWRNDTYEVSDDEITHVDRVPLGLSEDRMSAGLGRIQNVSMSIPSPIHWLFNFGNVECQTAAEVGAFVFFAVPDPRAVAQEIQTRMERYRRQDEIESARKRSQELPDWFEMYNRIEQEESNGRSMPLPTSRN